MKKTPNVAVAKGRKIPKARLESIRKKSGGSNAGKYDDVAPEDFAGGKENPYSFPINTPKRARAALAYAGNAQKPNKVRARVCRKYKGMCSKKTLAKIKGNS